MKRTLLIVLAAAAALAGWAQSDNYGRVNVMIGTNGMGHTFPGACYPNGSVQLSPDTDTIPHNVNGVYQPRAYDYCAGYQYRDNTIVGFSHTHLSGTGHSDLGDILVMPYTGATRLNPGTKERPDDGYRQRFSHATEQAEPGYYAVTLADDGIRCELTATPHCGLHRYTFPKGAAQKMVLDLNHGIYNYDGKVLWAQCYYDAKHNQISGYRVTSGWSRVNVTYFCIECSKKVKDYGCRDFAPKDYNGFWGRFDTEHRFPEMGGTKLVTWFEFEDDGNDTLQLIVSLSAVSRDGADKNLYADVEDMIDNQSYAGWSTYFDQARRAARYAWSQRLDAVEAPNDGVRRSYGDETRNADARAMLSTSLYHCFINPSVYQDATGQYRGVDQQVHTNAEGTNYTVFSVWDTYRALHPLLTLLDSNLTDDIVHSFLNHAEQSPHRMLPVWSHMGSENWCMIGYHGVSVIADAMQKGYLADREEAGPALYAMSESANKGYYSNTDTYLRLGYVPIDLNRSGTSVTLENAYEDWTIYSTVLRMKAQYPELHLDDSLAGYYRQRALNYRNVFDTAIGFVRARYADGTWKQPYSLLSTSGEGLIEGNAWNYSFYVPHDVNGLMRLMGGERQFVKKLDTLFAMYLPDEFFAETEDVTREGMLGGYVQGNEPSHHIPYLYMWTSQPWKTQYWMREIMNKMYRNHIDGLCGNDDCGQMSAWYVFGVLGFYPVCPGSGEYVLGAPYLPYTKTTLANGRTLEVKAPAVSDKNRYIQQVRWNGKPYTLAFVTHEMLMEGGVLEFDMGPKPNKRLFQLPEQKPYSLSER